MNMDISRGRGFVEAEIRQPEQVIADILAETVVQVDRKNKKIKYLLNYGSKVLTLTFLEADHSFMTVIESDLNTDRQENETTLLYQAAKKLMYTRANSLGKSLHYGLFTSNDKLINWARTRGNKLFHWNSEVVHDDSQTGLEPIVEFGAEIEPKQQKRTISSRLAA